MSMQDILDALDFMLHEHPPSNEWAALRASMGRALPWSLKYVTLGNEECLRDWYAQVRGGQGGWWMVEMG